MARSSRLALLAATAIVATFGLAACSSDNSGAEATKDASSTSATTGTDKKTDDSKSDSKTEETTAPAENTGDVTAACAEVGSIMTEASQGMADASAQLATDPQAAATSMQGFVDSLKTAAASVSNADVKAATETFAADYQEFVDLFATIDLNDPASLQTAATELTTVSEKVTASGAAFTELCTP